MVWDFFGESRAGLAQSIQYHTLLPLVTKKGQKEKEKNDRQKSYGVCSSKQVISNVTLIVFF